MMDKTLVVTAGGVENQQYKQQLFTNLQKLWLSRKMLDITFKVEGEQIQAHQLIIGASSKQLCDEIMEINKTCKKVELNLNSTGVTLTGLQQLLTYLYFGKMALNNKTCSEVELAAKTLCMPQVITLCRMYKSSLEPAGTTSESGYPKASSTNDSHGDVLNSTNEHAIAYPAATLDSNSLNMVCRSARIDQKETNPEHDKSVVHSKEDQLEEFPSTVGGEIPAADSVDQKCELQNELVKHRLSWLDPYDKGACADSLTYQGCPSVTIKQEPIDDEPFCSGAMEIPFIDPICIPKVENTEEIGENTDSKSGSSEQLSFDKMYPIPSDTQIDIKPSTITDSLSGMSTQHQFDDRASGIKNAPTLESIQGRKVIPHCTYSRKELRPQYVLSIEESCAPVATGTNSEDCTDNPTIEAHVGETGGQELPNNCSPAIPSLGRIGKKLSKKFQKDCGRRKKTKPMRRASQIGEVSGNSAEEDAGDVDNVSEDSEEEATQVDIDKASGDGGENTLADIDKVPKDSGDEKTQRDPPAQIAIAMNGRILTGDSHFYGGQSYILKNIPVKAHQETACSVGTFDKKWCPLKTDGTIALVSPKEPPVPKVSTAKLQPCPVGKVPLKENEGSNSSLYEGWVKDKKRKLGQDASDQGLQEPLYSSLLKRKNEPPKETSADSSSNLKNLRLMGQSSTCISLQPNVATGSTTPTNRKIGILPQSKLITINSVKREAIRKIICILCGFHFANIDSCEAHILRKHIHEDLVFMDEKNVTENDHTVKVEKSEAQKKMFMCDRCGFMTEAERFIYIHRLYQHGVPILPSMVQPYCEICEILFRKDTDVAKHEDKHKTHYRCNICLERYICHFQILKHLQLQHQLKSSKDVYYSEVVYD